MPSEKAKTVAGWAAVIAAIPALIASVSGYVNAKAELARLEADRVKQAQEKVKRDAAIWDAYTDILNRWESCVRGEAVSAPAPAPPPPEDEIVKTPDGLDVLRKNYRAQDLPVTPSRALDALAKQHGFAKKD